MIEEVFALDAEYKVCSELKEEIFIVDNETDVLINYVSVMQYPLFSLFSMTNGPITKSKFGNNDDEESYMS